MISPRRTTHKPLRILLIVAPVVGFVLLGNALARCIDAGLTGAAVLIGVGVVLVVVGLLSGKVLT